MEPWTYPVELRHEHGGFHAYVPALPEAIASGPTEADALREAREAVIAAVRGRIKDGMELIPPAPTKSEHHIALPARLAAKAAVYAAWRSSGLTKVALARKIGRNEIEARRILDPDHGTKLDQLEEAAHALGGRLSISFAEEVA